jgi:hypothetical protein
MELFHQFIYNYGSKKDITPLDNNLEIAVDLNNLVEYEYSDDTERTDIPPSAFTTSVDKLSILWEASKNNTLSDNAYDFRNEHEGSTPTFVPVRVGDNFSQLHQDTETSDNLEHVRKSSFGNKLITEPKSNHIFGLSQKKHLNSSSDPINQNVTIFHKQLVRRKRQVHSSANTDNKRQDVKCQKVLKKISSKMHSLESRFASLEHIISELKEPIETSDENPLEISSLQTERMSEINLSENSMSSENISTVSERLEYKSIEQEINRAKSERPATLVRVIKHTSPSDDTVETSTFPHNFSEMELGNIFKSVLNVTASKTYEGLFSSKHTVTVPTTGITTPQEVKEIDKDYGFVTSITDSETVVNEPYNDSAADIRNTESSVSRKNENINVGIATEINIFPYSLTYENETKISNQSQFFHETTQREFNHRSKDADLKVNKAITYNNITTSLYEHQDMEKLSHKPKEAESEYIWEVEKSETSNENRDQDFNNKSARVENLQKVTESEIQVINEMENTQTADFDVSAHGYEQDLNEDLSTIPTMMFTSHQNPTNKNQETTEPTVGRGRHSDDIVNDSYHLSTYVISENVTELPVIQIQENTLQEEVENGSISSSTGINITEVMAKKTDIFTSTSKIENKDSLAVNSKQEDREPSSETATSSNAQNKNVVLVRASNEMYSYNVISTEATAESIVDDQGDSEDFVTESFKRNNELSLEIDSMKKLQEYSMDGDYATSTIDINYNSIYERSESSPSLITEETTQKQNENDILRNTDTTNNNININNYYSEYEVDTVPQGTTAWNSLQEENENDDFLTTYVDTIKQNAYKDIETSTSLTINENLKGRSGTENTVKLSSHPNYESIYEDNITFLQTTQILSYEVNSDKDSTRYNTGATNRSEHGVTKTTLEATTFIDYSNYNNSERTFDTNTETGHYEMKSVVNVVAIHPDVNIQRAHEDKFNSFTMQAQSQEQSSKRESDIVEEWRYENSNDSTSRYKESSYGETASQESVSTVNSDIIQSSLIPEDFMYETTTEPLILKTYRETLEKNFTKLQSSFTIKSPSQNANESLPLSSKRSEYDSVAYNGYAKSVTVNNTANIVSNDGTTNNENKNLPSREETEERTEKLSEVIIHSNPNEMESGLEKEIFMNLPTNVQHIDISSSKLLKPVSHIHTRGSVNIMPAREEVYNFATNSYSGPDEFLRPANTLHKIGSSINSVKGNSTDFPSHFSSPKLYPLVSLNNGLVSNTKFGNTPINEINDAGRQDMPASAVLVPTFWIPYPLCIYRLPVSSDVLTAGPVFPSTDGHAEAFNSHNGVDINGIATWQQLTEEQEHQQQWEKQQHQQQWLYNLNSLQYSPTSPGYHVFYPGVLTAHGTQSDDKGISRQQNLYCAPIISPILIQSAPPGFILPTSSFGAPDARVQTSHSQGRQEFPDEQISMEELLGFQSKGTGKTG